MIDPQEVGDLEWGWTPDVLLFGAAAVMSIGVILFSIWLFARAAREEAQRQPGKRGDS